MPELIPTILLVEDDRPTRELYERELGREFRILACASEYEALTRLENQSFNAVILEPALQNGQGWGFLIKLRAMPQTRDIPIILCSFLDEQRRGLELGATFCLLKPVLPETLGNTVRQVIAGSESN